MKSFRVDGRVALVTGAARGLGWEIAQGLAAAGARVVLNGRRMAPLEERVAQLLAQGHAAEALAFDVADSTAESVVTDLCQRHGRLDILVNNVGLRLRQPFDGLLADELRQQLEVNL